MAPCHMCSRALISQKPRRRKRMQLEETSGAVRTHDTSCLHCATRGITLYSVTMKIDIFFPIRKQKHGLWVPPPGEIWHYHHLLLGVIATVSLTILDLRANSWPGSEDTKEGRSLLACVPGRDRKTRKAKEDRRKEMSQTCVLVCPHRTMM